MGFYKIRRVIVIAVVARELRAVHADVDVLAHLEVQVRLVEAEGRADGGDLLAARHKLPLAHEHLSTWP